MATDAAIVHICLKIRARRWGMPVEATVGGPGRADGVVVVVHMCAGNGRSNGDEVDARGVAGWEVADGDPWSGRCLGNVARRQADEERYEADDENDSHSMGSRYHVRFLQADSRHKSPLNEAAARQRGPSPQRRCGVSSPRCI